MAFDFAAGTNVIQYANSALLDNVAPCTFSGWMQKDSNGGGGYGRVVSKNENRMFTIESTSITFAYCVDGGRASATDSFPNNSAEWVHFLATYDGSNDATGIAIYKNGIESTPYSITWGSGIAPNDAGANLAIGNRGNGNLERGYDGRLACIAIWNVVLSAAEITSLAKGFKPPRIRPKSLLFYAPLIRDPLDVRLAAAATVSGATAINYHPRVY